jgi:hypothetical protein
MRARVVVALALLAAGPAAAQQSPPTPNLRQAPVAQQVRGVEYDLAFKVDSTPSVSAGFADLEELRRLPKAACRD